MSVVNSLYPSHDHLLAYLRERFPNRDVISSSEFRQFLHISPSTDQRMRSQGTYPRTISLPGVKRDPRILLIDLAIWLEQGGCPKPMSRIHKKRGRGSDTWKRNHLLKSNASPKDSFENSSEGLPNGALTPVIESAEYTNSEILKNPLGDVLHKNQNNLNHSH